MYRNLLGLLAVFGVGLLLVAVTFSASQEERADFTYVSGSEPKSMDPHIMTGQLEGRLADAIFEGLVRRDPKTLRPIPAVAEAMPEISEDLRTYTFRLREDARWTDGEPVTAHDFAWSWRRLQRPELGAEYAYIHHMIEGAQIYNTYGVQAKSIRETILPELAKVRAASAKGLDAAAWRAFIDEHDVVQALKNVEDDVLVRALTMREGQLDDAALGEIAEALEREARRRQGLFDEVEPRYGVDMGVWAEDDYTLVVRLAAPCPYFLDIVAFYSSLPVPRQVVGVQDEEERYINEQDWFLPEKIVSNGPYQIGFWRVNDRMRLEKNPRYWNAAATPLQTIDALAIENYTTALNLYLTDAADWVPGNYPNDLVDQLKDRADFYRSRGLGVYYYRFNVTRPPLDDPRVRQALCMAVDRKLIVEQVMRLGQLPAHHLVPPLDGYDPPASGIRFDPEAASALLAEAGFPRGEGIPELGILYNTSESHKKVAEVVADQLRRNLGVSANAYNQEWQAYQATTQKLDYWLARAGWIGDYVDPNTFIDMWVTNGGNNQTGWGDPLYDSLVRTAADVTLLLDDSEDLFARLKEPEVARAMLEAFRTAKDTAAKQEAGARLRMQMLREAEAILVQDAFPILPIYFYVWSGLVKPFVTGFYADLEYPDGSRGANLQDIHPLRALGVER